jgi:pilus assembly protein CpaC
MNAMGTRTMATKTATIRFACGIAFAACAAMIAPSRAVAGGDPPANGAAYEPAAGAPVRFIPIGVGKSIVIDLPRDTKEVLVADPATANVIMRSARRAYMIGVKVGQTNVFFFDEKGRQIAGFDVAVTRNLNGIRAALKRVLPLTDIKVEGIGEDGILLTGVVANAAESQLAYNVAARLVNKGATAISTGTSGGGNVNSTTTYEGPKTEGVVNGLTIRGRDQVMLRVTVAEVQRDVAKQFGVNISGTLGYGNAIVDFNNNNPFATGGAPLSNSSIFGGWFSGGNSVRATLTAMERAGVIRTLAEPNLTAISGESASFLAGGEFPVLGGLTCETAGICTREIKFKKFGVSLSFTPVVLSEGRISLKVLTEVSELSAEGAVSVGSGSQEATIPGLRTRRAETTVEIPSGGALAMAGMIQEQTKQAMHGLPGLQQVPILGALFRSRDYINRQTELMVIVTPYIVRAVAQRELSRPDDGFADPSDPESIFLGKLNRIYGVKGKGDPRRPFHGSYGFILD